MIKILSNKWVFISLYALFAIFASIQSLTVGQKTFSEGGGVYSEYNNYTIFERSFHHLKDHKDLYILYPEEQWDLYKYTPTFAAFFGLFAVFPDWLGLNLWNLLNAFVLLIAVYYLPRLTKMQKGGVLLIALIELMTSMQNEQSNGLIAGLLILAFGLLENKKYFIACMCIVFAAYIKIFGIVGVALFLLYPQKWKLAVYTILCGLLLFIIPLVFISMDEYIALFKSYGIMLGNDHSASYGFSVMGWLYTWFGITINKNLIVAVGALVFMVPFLKIKAYQNFNFRYLIVASILIWIVIFNHKAESPTFIIAMAGVALWFITSAKNYFNIILFCLALLFTSLSPTDIFPAFIRNGYLEQYTLKAVPCIFIWFKIIYDLLILKNDTLTEEA